MPGLHVGLKMKRLPASSKPAKFNQLSSLATVTGFIGLSFGVLVLVFSLQWQEGQTGRELSRSLHGRGEYETIIYVEHVGSQRRIYQNRDQSDITDYSIEELLNRAHASTEKGLDEVFVLLVVGGRGEWGQPLLFAASFFARAITDF